MILSEATVPTYRFRRGSVPLVVSMPHAGTFVPPSMARAFADIAAQRPDTDWHLPRLYDFLDAIGASVIAATHSRYVIDLNRPPDDASLYPGQDTTGLCPIDTFAREPLYRTGGAPDRNAARRRVDRVWRPYHQRLANEIERMRAEHGVAVLWDAHSIRSEVPRFFPGRLADFNLGTAGGISCDPGLEVRLERCLQGHKAFTHSVNGRFRGGYITRQYGRPAENVHAVQMEMSIATYADERCPYAFREPPAAKARAVLREQLETAIDWALHGSRA